MATRSLENEIHGIIGEEVAKATRGLTVGHLKEAYVGSPKTYGTPAEILSEKTKKAHKELYETYVSNMNNVSAQLDTVNRGDVNPGYSEFAYLKTAESFNVNATWLHELYFAATFDPRSDIEVDSKTFMRLERDFGSFDDWQRDFIACAMAAGEGWAVTAYSTYLRRYVNTVIRGHSQDVMLGLHPIIVLDMWSHSYYRDYLGDKQNYILSSMTSIDWTIVEDRLNVCEKIALLVGGSGS